MLLSRLAETAEAIKVEPMIAQMHGRVAVGEFFQAVEAGFRASDRPARRGKLAGQIPVRRSPDVLGMGRAAPGQATKLAGIARHRCRRVREMGMQPSRVFRPFGRQHERLSETADAIARKVAGKIAQPAIRARARSPAAAGRQTASEPRAAARHADIPADNGRAL